MTIEAHDARQIRALRAAIGWSVSQMGEASGLHRNSVQTIESCADIKRYRLTAMEIAIAASKHGVVCDTQDGAPIIRFRKLEDTARV